MMYSAVIPVRVSLAGGTLRDAVAQVTDQLADIDEHTPATPQGAPLLDGVSRASAP